MRMVLTQLVKTTSKQGLRQQADAFYTVDIYSFTFAQYGVMSIYMFKCAADCRRNQIEQFANLLEIKDQYLKYVVMLDELAAGNLNGVKIIHLADFLSVKNTDMIQRIRYSIMPFSV